MALERSVFVGVFSLLEHLNILSGFLCLSDCLLTLGAVLEWAGEYSVPLLELHVDFKKRIIISKLLR
jgi:hypothetical protein